MDKIEFRDPVREGFFAGLGLLMSGLLTALIIVVLYVFYLTFLL